MKNYIISIISGALFVSFVTYATVQTKQIENQKTLATETINTTPTEPSNLNVASLNDITSDPVTKEVNILPITDNYKKEKPTIYKYENKNKKDYEEDEYDEEDEDDNDD